MCLLTLCGPETYYGTGTDVVDGGPGPSVDAMRPSGVRDDMAIATQSHDERAAVELSKRCSSSDHAPRAAAVSAERDNATRDVVIFDLGGVVLNSPFNAIAEYERELNCSPNTINAIIAHAGSNGAFARLERGELDIDTFAAPFAEDCRQAINGSAGIDGRVLMERICHACTPRPLMVEALRVLKKDQFVQTAALTNNFLPGRSRSSFTDSTEAVRDLFDVVVESAVERLRKPDPAIYAITCNRLKVAPTRCIFIDDIGRNLKTAAAMGMATIKCSPQDTRGERALLSLCHLLRGEVQVKLRQIIRRARL